MRKAAEFLNAPRRFLPVMLGESFTNRLAACVEVLAHRNKPDFREVCKGKLRCSLKPDISEEDLEQFLCEVEALVKATSAEEKTDDVVFFVSASW